MLRRVWLMSIVVCVAGHAFAEEAAPVQPAAPVAATPAAAPANASPTAVARVDERTPATEAAAAPAEEDKLDAEKIMAAQKAGYQLKNENGQQLLCRKELQTGSRVRYKTSCLTARQWEQLEADTKLQLRAIERRPQAVSN